MKFRPDPKPEPTPKKKQKPLQRKTPLWKGKRLPFSKQIEKKEKKLSGPSYRQKLVKILDHVFSKYIRKRGADSAGFNKCFTCPTRAHWKSLQCGHFISRKNLATRWDEDNCRPQCESCNMFKNGMPKEFARKLGQEMTMSLDLRAHKSVKFDASELMEMIKKYETTLK